MSLGLLLVNKVKTLGFNELVKGTTSKTSEELHSLSVIVGLTLSFTVFVVSLDSFIRSGTSNEFVTQMTLMLMRSVLELVVVFLESVENTPILHNYYALYRLYP